jgi:hypothetical protein
VAGVGASLSHAHSPLHDNQTIGRFRRKRRALALARTCHGVSTAVHVGACPEGVSTDADRVAADTFSRTIREYSAREQLPRAIMRLR